jgi:hypothetical protein
MVPIVAGLLMGAALGGGIAALQKKDVLQGALMGGIGGALGGAFMPAAGGIAGATEGAVAGGIGGGLEGAAGASIMNPAVGVSGLGAGAAPASVLGQNVLTNSVTSGGIPSVIGQGAVNAAAPMTVAPLATPALSTATTAAAAQPFSIGNFLSQNKYALAGGALGGMMAPGQEPDKPDEGNIRDYTFNREMNPLFGQPGQPYFNDSYTAGAVTPVEDYNKADGGIVGLADGGIAGYSSLGLGGPQDYRVPELIPVQTNTYAPNIRPMAPEVAAYNTQMMQRANQQYNVNQRPAALQVVGFDRPAAPVASSGVVDPGRNQMPEGPTDYIDDYYQQMLGRNADPTGRKAIENAIGKSWYDPARDIPDVIRKSAEFKQSGKNPNPTGIEIGKKYGANAPSTGGGIGGLGYDPKTGRYTGTFNAPNSGKTDMQKMREELDALKSEKAQYNDTGGGNAAGGLMRYAMGGDIGTRYQSPDDTGGMGDKVGAHQTVNMAPHYPMQGLYQGYADGGHLGDYSDGGRLLKGPGDGVSDDIPAQIGARQPARLADGEFVVPARIVSELGNGSTDAGAKRLYAMMDRVQKARKKSVGKDKVAVDSKASRHLPV